MRKSTVGIYAAPRLKASALFILLLLPAFIALPSRELFALGISGLSGFAAGEGLLDSLKNGVDTTRFSYNKLIGGLDEPMEIALLPNYDILIAERKGAVKLYNSVTRTLSVVTHLDVFSGIEDGLLGIAVDPSFSKNRWVYLYHSVAGSKWISQLTRYEFRDNQLLASSRKVLLEIPTQRKYCCHSAGYLTFGSDGLLYLSTGDNTNAEEIEGHNPTDERPGRELSDGQASTANSNDYRGKILRIRPEADGSYSIPDGNLFPKDGTMGKPEIYVMGLRNPFRFSVDAKNQFVYWGDVGPSSDVPGKEGTLSYDEINQAKGPGFFGYPYFLGENEAFPRYDFETKKEGPGKDPFRPLNESPNNTGVRELPPAQPAFMWYGPLPSTKWPLVGKGGASAMAGPVYYSDLYPNAPYKLPKYYHGKLFIYDWVRRWIMAVTLDREGNYVAMESFLPALNVVAPMDMQIAPDGAVYLLAYGTNWFAKNTDSGIIRVEYAEGNRRPVAHAKVNKTVGAVPLKVELSGEESRDFDSGDKLSYKWTIGKRTLNGKLLSYTFNSPGIYDAVLTVTDNHGASSSSSVQISVGNEPPVVQIKTNANQSFYWADEKVNYQVIVTDREDRPVRKSQARVFFDYLPFGKDLAMVLSQGGEDFKHSETIRFYKTLDCGSCHGKVEKSIGPSLSEIAKRYSLLDTARASLVNKIIKGGSGNWGTYPMPPHPHLSKEKTEDIVDYILSLVNTAASLPLSGTVTLAEPEKPSPQGVHVLQASYTDGGFKGMPALTTRVHLVFRNPQIEMEDYSEGTVGVSIGTLNTNFITSITGILNNSYARYDDIDLGGLESLRFRVLPSGSGGTISLRLDSKAGLEVGRVEIPAAGDSRPDWQDFSMKLNSSTGRHNVYVVFTNSTSPYYLFQVDHMEFQRKSPDR